MSPSCQYVNPIEAIVQILVSQHSTPWHAVAFGEGGSTINFFKT